MGIRTKPNVQDLENKSVRNRRGFYTSGEIGEQFGTDETCDFNMLGRNVLGKVYVPQIIDAGVILKIDGTKYASIKLKKDKPGCAMRVLATMHVPVIFSEARERLVSGEKLYRLDVLKMAAIEADEVAHIDQTLYVLQSMVKAGIIDLNPAPEEVQIEAGAEENED